MFRANMFAVAALTAAASSIQPCEMDWYEKESALARQFARAVTADRILADEIARDALEGFDPDTVDAQTRSGHRLAVLRALFEGWRRSGRELPPGIAPDGEVQSSMLPGAGPERQLLLLVDVLGLMPADAAELLELDPAQATAMLTAERETAVRPVQGGALVVEDEFVIALDVASILEDLGLFIVGIARTRQQAVDMARHHRPDIMLVDYDLGGETGMQVVQEIATEIPVAVIFLTAFPDEVLSGEGFAPAFVLDKPFRERALRAAVVHALEMARHARLESRSL